ncbi:MAG: patatin-like phospholipase family protein [Candidatus Thermoplasmatota archaeon]|nr:patatin-like phospholipase family protein [Candidatus Thermoplasmatota archaeon]
MEHLTKEGRTTLERLEKSLLDLREDPDLQISSSGEKDVIDIVFAGGGAKGVAHLGAIWAFDKLGIRFKRLAGTSAGALTASIVAAGFDCDQLVDELFNMNFMKLRDGFWDQRLPKLARIAAVSTSYGMYEGEKLQSWIEQLLAKKNANTFGRLPMEGVGMLAPLDKKDGPRLSIMASDVSHSCELLMPRDLVLDRYGNIRPSSFPISAAVRMSVSVPFFFTPYKVSKSLIVDGAFATNLPLEVFDVDDPTRVRWPTLGIKLGSTIPGKNSTQDLFHFGLAVFDTMRYGQSKMTYQNYPTRMCRLVEVNTGEIRTLDFGITKEQKEQLFLNGARSVLYTLRGDDGRGIRTVWNFKKYIKLRTRWSFPDLDEPYI